MNQDQDQKPTPPPLATPPTRITPPPAPPPAAYDPVRDMGATLVERGRRSLAGSTFKLFLIGVLTLIMLIPVFKIWSLLEERQARRDAAVSEITGTWGKEQEIVGPVLVVPYRYTVKTQRTEVVNGRSTIVEADEHPTGRACFLPSKLKIDAKLDPQTRKRSIYKAVVYGGQIAISGEFQTPSFDDLGVKPDEILWDEAVVAVAATDLRGVDTALALSWNGKEIPLTPGCPLPGFDTGISARLRGAFAADFAEKAPAAIPFSLNLRLNGSKGIRFAPIGMATEARLAAAWPDPSFCGAFLPAKREITPDGFDASWSVSYYGRGYPQKWTENGGPRADKLRESMFGVSLLTTVDQYRTVERALKYAILFIVLAFAGFFLFEVMARVRIHPVQYTLVGATLCLFYLLLLALSEFAGFGIAYLAGAVASSLLIGVYTTGVLRNGRRGLLTALSLGGVYGFLYVVLQLEDYSLLIGSAGLFIVLAAIMLATRRMDCYNRDAGGN